MPDLLGINKDAYFSYLKAQFSSALHDIVACNLAIINAKEGIDRDGYALRLGICLAIADRKNKR